MGDSRPFPWGLWAFIGFVGWIVFMLALGLPTLMLVAPAAGVLCGWAVGGVFYVALALIPRPSRKRR